MWIIKLLLTLAIIATIAIIAIAMQDWNILIGAAVCIVTGAGLSELWRLKLS